VTRAAEVERPASVGLLEREQAIGHLAVEIGALPAHEPVEEDVLRLHRHVRFERRVPVPVRVLARERVPRRRVDRLVYARHPHAAALVVHPDRLPIHTSHAFVLPWMLPINPPPPARAYRYSRRRRPRRTS
jgi:hypothetical protein